VHLFFFFPFFFAKARCISRAIYRCVCDVTAYQSKHVNLRDNFAHTQPPSCHLSTVSWGLDLAVPSALLAVRMNLDMDWSQWHWHIRATSRASVKPSVYSVLAFFPKKIGFNRLSSTIAKKPSMLFRLCRSVDLDTEDRSPSAFSWFVRPTAACRPTVFSCRTQSHVCIVSSLK